MLKVASTNVFDNRLFAFNRILNKYFPLLNKRNKNIKRILIIIGIGIPLIMFYSLFALNIWMGRDVRENINIAKQQYSGSTEDALISFLLDENNSTYDRTHKAVWTLGRIRSEKALPILKDLYKNDPEGKTCYGRHDSFLCQYEIHKAIVAVENGWFFSHARLK